MTIFATGAAADAATAALTRRISSVAILRGVCKTLAAGDLLRMLRAAEAEVARRLRVPLEPTWIFSEDASEEEIAARLPANSPYEIEPGYDYDPSSFKGPVWGYLVTRHKPIIRLESYRFVYSDPKVVQFTVPPSWFRLDRKYGHVRLLPTGELATLPFNSALLQIFAGARVIPNMIRLHYLAGISDLPNQYPDLYDFILRVATLLLIRNTFPGASGSISADGLSRSTSFDISAYADMEKGAIEGEYARWRQFFHGIQTIVL